MAILPLALFAAIQSVSVADHPIREGCEARAKIVGNVKAGEPVELRFAITGEMGACYKVTARDGAVKGYLPAAALASVAEFEASRRAAAGIDTATPASAPVSPAPQIGAHVAAAGGTEALKAAQLLAANQPGQALDILEKLVRKTPGNSNLLAMAGLAAYHSDHIAQSVRYWEQSLALQEDPRIRALLGRARRETAGDRSTGQLTGIRFQFRFDTKEVTPAQARALVPVLDGEFTRVSEQLGCRAEERITAVIQGREAYLRTTGAAEWSAGLYDGRIRVAMLEPSPGEETRRSFAHEIVHACLARTGSWPSWLHEGLAQYLSGRRAGAQERALVKRMAQAKALPALEQLSGGWSRMSTGHAETAYASAMVAAELMYTRMGTAGVRSLLQNPDRLQQVSRQLDQWMRE